MTRTATQLSRGRHSLRAATIAMLIALIVATGSGTAYAYWSTQTAHSGSAVAGVALPMPATMTCQNMSIILVSVARVSWAAVPGATGYRVVVSRASGGTSTTINQTGTSIDLSSGVLGDLLTGLLAPSVLTVRVYPTYSAGAGIWVSANSRAWTANATALPIGTTCRGAA